MLTKLWLTKQTFWINQGCELDRFSIDFKFEVEFKETFASSNSSLSSKIFVFRVQVRQK